MNRIQECPVCGCTTIGEGVLSGYASMMPAHRIFSTGSKGIADVCTRCGHILSMRVANPSKFK
ncbi:MAG TPA: transcription initiation factor TFIIIB [Clostridium sp.]|jgi:predicted nucleic-acid-binding Zn-ribbon protein|nr:transcription initiation factor TFIIIB [Clostridium sp.]